MKFTEDIMTRKGSIGGRREAGQTQAAGEREDRALLVFEATVWSQAVARN